MTQPGAMEPGVPVFDPRDAEIYGWRFEPGEEGNLWLRVTRRATLRTSLPSRTAASKAAVSRPSVSRARTPDVP